MNISQHLLVVFFLLVSVLAEAQIPITRGNSSFASSFDPITACGPNEYTTSFIQQSWNNFRITYYNNGNELKVDNWTKGSGLSWECFFPCRLRNSKTYSSNKRIYLLFNTVTKNVTKSLSPFTCAPLPVDLLTFTVTKNNSHAYVSWETATEKNNDYFTIEKSTNLIDWKTVETIEGAGNSLSLLSYSTVDQNPYKGTSYYRLKQTDYDGKFEYSQIRSVNLNKPIKELKVYPNPATDQITIEGIKGEQTGIHIYNVQGENVSHLINTVKSREPGLSIDLSQLSVGIYFIKVDSSFVKVLKE